MVAKVFKGRFPTLGDLKSYHPVGEPGWFAKVAWVDYYYANGDWSESDGSGGGGGTLSDDDKAEIAKIAGLDSMIKKDGGELAAGESIAQGANRTYAIGDVVFTLENRQTGTRTVANPIDAAELDKWTVLGQFPASSLTFPASKLIPKGYQLQHTDGAILQNKATRVTPATIDLTKWTVVVEGTTSTKNWILNANDDYAEGDELFKGDNRRLDVGGTGVQITYRGVHTKACPALSVTVLADWEIIPNTPIDAYPTGQPIAPKGFLYRRNSQLLKLKANTKLPTTFDPTQWESVIESVRQILTGQTFDLLDSAKDGEPKIGICAGGTLSNAPSSAGQNIQANWYYSGNATDGRVVLSVIRAGLSSLIGNWEIVRTGSTWGAWVKINASSIWNDTTDNGFCFTGSQYNWVSGHRLKITYLDASVPLVIRPKTNWGEIGTIIDSANATVDTLPTSGSEPIHLYFNLAKARWEIRNPDPSTFPTVQYTANGTLRGYSHRALLMAGATAMILPAGDRQAVITASWVDGATAPTITAAGTERITGTKSDGTPFDDTAISLTQKGRTVTVIGKSTGGQLLTIGG